MTQWIATTPQASTRQASAEQASAEQASAAGVAGTDPSLADTALAITEAIPVGTYTMVLPPAGGMASFAFMSDRFLEICGLQREEAATDAVAVFACVHPDDHEAWVRLNAETFAHKRPFQGQCRLLVNGEVRWVSAESVPRQLADGSTVWEGVLIDITRQQEALEQLDRERTLLNTVLTHIDALVYMKDAEGRYLYANPSTANLLSAAGGDVIGRTDTDLLGAESGELIRRLDAQVLQEGRAWRGEERLPDATGRERIFLAEKMIYRCPGQADCLIGFSTEITELHQARERLAASEEHFRLLAENSSDVVFRLANDGRILWVSPSLTPTLGWLPQEWLGRVGTEFLVHRGETVQYRANWKTLKSGQEVTLARDQVRARDGSIHWIETHAAPYRNGKGEVDGIVASFRRIDEEVAAERELQISEERYRLLAENARDVIWTLEPDGVISSISPAIQQLRGLTPAEAMAQAPEQVHPPESLERFQAFVRGLHHDLEQGREPRSFRGELEYYGPGASTIWAEVIALPVLDDQGRLENVLGVSRDISERKRFEQQLTEANRQLEALATTDALTGIWNRRHLESLVQQAIARSDRYGEPLTLILIDLDNFKGINDRFGHLMGDQVLIEFCRRIRRQLRSSDAFGRWGGEEFLILMPRCQGVAGVAVAEKLRQLLEATPIPELGTVTASFGVAQRLEREAEVDWFRRVDQLLYGAKLAGRNRVMGA